MKKIVRGAWNVVTARGKVLADNLSRRKAGKLAGRLSRDDGGTVRVAVKAGFEDRSWARTSWRKEYRDGRLVRLGKVRR